MTLMVMVIGVGDGGCLRLLAADRP